MSISNLAHLAGMDPGYVEYIETSPEVSVSRSGLIRLAAALETSTEKLSGAGSTAPDGRGGGACTPELRRLSRDECEELLRPGGVGRFVFLEARGPVALPVNFRMLGSDIVFRTSPRTSLAARVGQVRTTFEVDHLDEARGEGWSVLASGPAHVVSDGEELARVKETHVRPWADGARDTYIRLAPQELTGRRIVAM